MQQLNSSPASKSSSCWKLPMRARGMAAETVARNFIIYIEPSLPSHTRTKLNKIRYSFARVLGKDASFMYDYHSSLTGFFSISADDTDVEYVRKVIANEIRSHILKHRQKHETQSPTINMNSTGQTIRAHNETTNQQWYYILPEKLSQIRRVQSDLANVAMPVCALDNVKQITHTNVDTSEGSTVCIEASAVGHSDFDMTEVSLQRRMSERMMARIIYDPRFVITPTIRPPANLSKQQTQLNSQLKFVKIAEDNGIYWPIRIDFAGPATLAAMCQQISITLCEMKDTKRSMKGNPQIRAKRADHLTMLSTRGRIRPLECWEVTEYIVQMDRALSEVDVLTWDLVAYELLEIGNIGKFTPHRFSEIIRLKHVGVSSAHSEIFFNSQYEE